MDYKNKIIKYKLKQNKIFNKINILLKKKKQEYTNSIFNTICDITFIPEIINILINNDSNLNTNNIQLENINNIQLENINNIQLENINKPDSNNLIIPDTKICGEIVIIYIVGIFGVGKTTLIEHIKNYLHQKSILINIKNSDDIINLNKNIFESILSNKNKIKLIFIESNLNFYESIIKLDLYNLYILQVIPKNQDSYKKKLINKLFLDMYTNITELLDFIIENSYLEQDLYLKNIINNLRNKNIFQDMNFNFIDKMVISLIEKNSLSLIEKNYSELNSNKNNKFYKILF